MILKAALTLLIITTLLLGCSAPERASFKEAYFAYLAAVEGKANGDEIDDMLTDLGWTRAELERKVERIRYSDPEGFTALLNEYRASTGLPK